MPALVFKRVLIKLSGELLGGDSGVGFCPLTIEHYIRSIKALVDLGIEVGVVVGGGNFIRGRDLKASGVDLSTADHIGMLGTVMNSLMLRDAFENKGLKAEVFSSFSLPSFCKTYSARDACRALETGHIVLFAGGIGSPFFTTDTCASVRAIEMRANLLIKITGVPGVFDKNPLYHSDAVLLKQLTFKQTIDNRYEVMDLTAFEHCRDHGIPIVVMQLQREDNLRDLALGAAIGTKIQ